MMIVVWGVSGSGKSTISQALARELKCPCFDADDFHPQSNIQKMAAGIPLTDDDRLPWLEKLRLLVDEYRSDEIAVMACSALKSCYRQLLGFDTPQVRSVLLQGDFELIASRLAKRESHFMPASLLQTQLDLLETEHTGLTLDAQQPPPELVSAITRWLAQR